jgi:tagaturonate reductase
MNLVPDFQIVQFGTGKLLRGLFAPLHQRPGQITVLQSRDTAVAGDQINQADQGYHLWIRGFQNGATVEEVHVVRSLGRALALSRQWPQIQAVFTDPTLRLLVSNTTEKGLQLDPRDASRPVADLTSDAPTSFPARLLALLWHRYRASGEGLAVLPLELLEDNALILQQRVLEQAALWQLDQDRSFVDWLRHDCRWLSTLVDRICVDVVPPVPWPEPDPLAVMTEPFQMLVVQDDGADRSILPDHPAVTWAPDLRPYFLQKVRLLNGLHTAMVARCLPLGFETVIDVMNDPVHAQWLNQLLYQELVPTLEQQGLQVREFAGQVLDRFRNPYFRHRLADIAVGHATKIQVRLQPTREEHQRLFGTPPPLLSEVLALPLPA